MDIIFTDQAWDDYIYWQQNDASITEKINTLLKDIKRDPFKGLGKPEPLRGNLTGHWSRRITDEHRIIYRVQGSKGNQTVSIIQARFHY